MDWSDFFERTRVAAKVDSFAKLAPLLGISDGAIGHYRQGRRVPQVWVVAEALKIQGNPEPEKAAIAIMKMAALSSEERGFWRRLAATAMTLCLGVGLALPQHAQAAQRPIIGPTVYTLCEVLDLAVHAPTPQLIRPVARSACSTKCRSPDGYRQLAQCAAECTFASSAFLVAMISHAITRWGLCGQGR